jgi:hypothetical protein
MSRDLPAHPNLEHPKNQATDLLKDFEQGNPAAVERFRSLGSLYDADRPKLADAQHAIAREYAFARWAKLKEHVESLAYALDPAQALKSAVIASNALRLWQVLEPYPELKSTPNDPLPNYGFGSTPFSPRCKGAAGK